MEVVKFAFGRVPSIVLEPGAIGALPGHVARYGRKALLVTGGSSLEKSGRLDSIRKSLSGAGISFDVIQVTGEPSPELVDGAVERFRAKEINAVVAVGGGSVIDAGKAISAMLHLPDSVTEYLELVGTRTHDGVKVPFIAAPTTAGTGSEATKNAVLSRTGGHGFKRSLRHDNLVPDLALVDPELMTGCPPDVTAAGGLDALTQLLESYVSTRSSPMTDALAWSGLERVRDCLIPVCTAEPGNIARRGGMAYAALMSGITLANAGLGVVHGLASPLGAVFGIPHGVACGTLLGVAVRATVKKLAALGDTKYLSKYARAGALLTGCDPRETGRCCERLADLLDQWVEALAMPRLSSFGVREEHFKMIIADGGNKNNPAALDEHETAEMLSQRL
jgi:alcohol dehydrogenase class IV